MDEVEERLRYLIVKTCRHAPDSTERQQGLTQIVRMIVRSGRLWRDNAPYYEDALQKTWLYFCRNLCEAATATEQYDPDRSNVITWLNAYLKRRLQDDRLSRDTDRVRFISRQKPQDESIDLIDNVPARPDIPPILEATREWVQTDPDGKLRSTHIQGHPKVTCQVLILERLPPETSWEILADRYNLSISTLSSFYRRQCMPRLRQFGETQGYL